MLRLSDRLSQRAVVASVFVAILSSGCGQLGRQPTGTPTPNSSKPAPSPRSSAQMAYDAARHQVVLFGGRAKDSVALGDTWTWDGFDWTERHPAASPTPRVGAGIAYDGARDVVVLFGGYGGPGQGSLAETWTWNGTDWTQQQPVDRPTARAGAVMEYDDSLRKVVLHGGNYLNDTWTWDGVNWTRLHPSTNPPGLELAGMAYHARSGTLVLLASEGPPASETYTFDGRAWIKRGTDPGTTPPRRSNTSMARDDARGTILVFGGDYDLNDTWTWNGQSWTRQYPSDSPSRRRGAAAAYDAARGVVVIFGGEGRGLMNETWTWDGSNWTLHGPRAAVTPVVEPGCPEPLNNSAVVPPARGNAAMAYDAARGVVVLFGGSGLCDTWTWDGRLWTQQHPRTVPPPRGEASMAYDAARRNVVLFGGNSTRDDTWIWDGADWHAQHPAHSPQGREMAAMEYNPRLGKVVLVGGYGVTGPNDTWTWDGTDWTALHLSTSPSTASETGLVFYPPTGTMLLYGSVTGLAPDVWSFDGQSWRRVDLAADPPLPIFFAGMAYDPAQKAIVFFGGDRGNTTWTWDGGQWMLQHPADSPPGRGFPPQASPGSRAAMTYDGRHANVVLFGGGGVEGLNDTWTWDGVTWAQRG